MPEKIIFCADGNLDTLKKLTKTIASVFKNDYEIIHVSGMSEGIGRIEILEKEQKTIIAFIISENLSDGKGDMFVIQAKKNFPKAQVIFISALNDSKVLVNIINQTSLFRVLPVEWNSEELLSHLTNAISRYSENMLIEKQNEELLSAISELKTQKKLLVISDKMNDKLLKNLKNINSSLERFVPKNFLKYLEKDSITEVNLGDGVQTELTILFSDIRSFTKISETMTPEENFAFLNSYLAMIGPAISRNNGFIVTYIGDAIMALFPGSELDAVKCAKEMLDELGKFNAIIFEKGMEPVKIGIGLNSGRVLLGIIGEAGRLEGTAISDKVNLSSRLESLTKKYGANIIVSSETIGKLGDYDFYKRSDDYKNEDNLYQKSAVENDKRIGPDEMQRFYYRFLDKVRVKGKNEPVSVFEILYPETDNSMRLKIQYRREFEQAVFLYKDRKFSEASEIFYSLVEKNPEDRAIQVFIDRTRNFLKINSSGSATEFIIPDDWDGADILDEK